MHPEFQSRKLEFYRAAYEKQLERRDHALERLSHIITIHTLVGGLIAYYASSVSEVSTDACFLLFFIPAAIGTCVYFSGITLLVVTLHKGTTLHVLPPPDDYDRVFTVQEQVLADTPEADTALVRGFEEALSDQYRQLATVNQAASNIRDSRYSLIARLGVWSLFLLIVGAPAFFVFQKQDDPHPTKVIITNPVHIMPEDPKTTPPVNQAPKPAQPAQAAQPATPPVRFVLPAAQPLNESLAARIEDIKTLEQKSDKK